MRLTCTVCNHLHSIQKYELYKRGNIFAVKNNSKIIEFQALFPATHSFLANIQTYAYRSHNKYAIIQYDEIPVYCVQIKHASQHYNDIISIFTSLK